MTLLDLLVMLVYFLLAAFAKITVDPVSLTFLTLALIIERVLTGERIPLPTRTVKAP